MPGLRLRPRGTAPDVGRAKLAQKFAEKVGADLAVLTKERPAQQVAEIGYVIGDVRGKTAVIVDDMIDTAGTLKAAANFEQVVVTDTIPLPPGAPDNVRVLSCADLLTNSIRQIFTDGSVSDVFGGENQLF